MKNWLQSLIADEKEAQRQYSDAASDAEQHGSDSLVKLFQHIRGEEARHQKELSAAMQRKGFMHGRN